MGADPGWGWLSETGRAGRRDLAQECAGLGHSCLALTIAQETEVADFDEPLRQQVQAEATHELLEAEHHDFALGPVGVVLPGEADGLRLGVQSQEAARTDGHPVGITADVVQHLFGSSKGRLGIYDPFRLSHRGQVTGELAAVPEIL